MPKLPWPFLFVAIALGAGCMESERAIERSLSQYDQKDITAWMRDERPSCAEPIYRYYPGVTLIHEVEYANCLDIEYLITPTLPDDVLSLPDVYALKAPGTLVDLEGIERLDQLRFLNLYIHRYHHARKRTTPLDLAPLARLQNLEHLGVNMEAFTDMRGLDPLAEISSLRFLSVFGWPYEDLSGLSRMTGLVHLRVGGENIKSAQALSGLKTLQVLELRNNRSLVDISAIASLTELRELNLWDTAVSDISALANLTDLEMLNLKGTDISSIESLRGKTRLLSLSLEGTHVADIGPLESASSLHSLSLKNTLLADLSPLAGMTRLRYLDLEGSNVTTLAPLRKLSNLEYLNIARLGRLDLAPLLRLPRLKYVVVDRAIVDPEQVRALEANDVVVGLPETD